MKTSKFITTAFIAALGLASITGAVHAQNAGIANPGLPPALQPPNAMPDQRAPKMSSDDRAAFFDARIAAVRAGLKLTPEQEKLWPPAESAVREMARTMAAAREKMQAEGKPTDPLVRMRRHADMTILRAESMKKVLDAAGPLYNALTPEQKKRLPHLARAGDRHGGWMGMNGMHMGGKHGMGDPDMMGEGHPHHDDH